MLHAVESIRAMVAKLSGLNENPRAVYAHPQSIEEYRPLCRRSLTCTECAAMPRTWINAFGG